MQTDKKELLTLEREYWRAVKNKDAEAVKRLSDETCILAGAQGVSTIQRDAIGNMIAKAPYTLHEFEIGDDAQVRYLGDDVAVLAYKVREKLTVDGKPVSLEAADSSTWIKRNGQWRCVVHTESLLGDPFGRDKRTGTA